MKTVPVVLRQWKDADLEPFAEMNVDAEVMRFFPELLSREESLAAMNRRRAEIDLRGWGLWVVESEGVFAGITGLTEPGFSAHFTPCVEIGWRLRREYWGRGIAFAAATQALAYAFETLKLPELVSFTAEINLRSRGLMERLGFARAGRDDFLHPTLAVESPLRPHVLYRKRHPAVARLEGRDS